MHIQCARIVGSQSHSFKMPCDMSLETAVFQLSGACGRFTGIVEHAEYGGAAAGEESRPRSAAEERVADTRQRRILTEHDRFEIVDHHVEQLVRGRCARKQADGHFAIPMRAAAKTLKTAVRPRGGDPESRIHENIGEIERPGDLAYNLTPPRDDRSAAVNKERDIGAELRRNAEKGLIVALNAVNAARPRSAAAASDDPPPSPPPTGIRLSSANRRRSSILKRAQNVSSARRTRLPASAGTSG